MQNYNKCKWVKLDPVFYDKHRLKDHRWYCQACKHEFSLLMGMGGIAGCSPEASGLCGAKANKKNIFDRLDCDEDTDELIIHIEDDYEE